MSKKRKFFFIIFSVGLLSLTVYLSRQFIPVSQQAAPKKELLVYCGITMIKPMAEIAAILEEREDIKISIIKGGSGNLLRAIQFNGLGDLYLPGAASYIRQATADGLITRAVHVGYNKAAILVQEGNPKGIGPTLNALKNPDYYVVIGNPDSGSIGEETKKILSSAGIFEEVLLNARELTTDSKRLVTVLKDGEADIVVNWYATATWPENANFIDALPIDERYATKKELMLALLSTAKYPVIAEKFMEYATSSEGQRIFDRYGFW
jgi:molybdate transport system substrate-binding protein